jgi:hypothetical protein
MQLSMDFDIFGHSGALNNSPGQLEGWNWVCLVDGIYILEIGHKISQFFL